MAWSCVRRASSVSYRIDSPLERGRAIPARLNIYSPFLSSSLLDIPVGRRTFLTEPLLHLSISTFDECGSLDLWLSEPV